MSSLDAPIGEDGEGQVHDIVEDENLASPDEQMEVFLNKERAHGMLEALDERERQIIELRYGLIDGEAKTLAEIAKVMGVSRERVRQLEVTILKKLRQVMKTQDNFSPKGPNEEAVDEKK